MIKAHTESGKESVSMEFLSHDHYIHHCEHNGKDAGMDERPFFEAVTTEPRAGGHQELEHHRERP